MQQSNARQSDQITDQRMRIEELERERNQHFLEQERGRGEATLLNEKIRSLEEEIRVKCSEFDIAQTELSEA